MAALGIFQPKAGCFLPLLLPLLAPPEGRCLVLEAELGIWWSADGLVLHVGKTKDRPSGDPAATLILKPVIGGGVSQTLGGTDKETESLG